MAFEAEDEEFSIKLLSNTVLFSGLNKQYLKSILPSCQKLQFPENTIIIQEGTSPEGIFVLMQGRVEVLKKKLELEENYRLAELGIGQCFGEMAVIDQSPRSASVRTIEPTTVLKISINNIDHLAVINMTIYATILKNIAIDLSKRLRYANELLSLRSENTSK